MVKFSSMVILFFSISLFAEERSLKAERRLRVLEANRQQGIVGGPMKKRDQSTVPVRESKVMLTTSPMAISDEQQEPRVLPSSSSKPGITSPTSDSITVDLSTGAIGKRSNARIRDPRLLKKARELKREKASISREELKKKIKTQEIIKEKKAPKKKKSNYGFDSFFPSH
jgi:hypothetical protein